MGARIHHRFTTPLSLTAFNCPIIEINGKACGRPWYHPRRIKIKPYTTLSHKRNRRARLLWARHAILRGSRGPKKSLYKTSRNKAWSFCRSFRNFMAYVSWKDSRAWKMVTRYLLSRSSSLLFQHHPSFCIERRRLFATMPPQIAPVIISSSAEWCQSTAFRRDAPLRNKFEHCAFCNVDRTRVILNIRCCWFNLIVRDFKYLFTVFFFTRVNVAI